jgi:hypothetical protein
VSDIVTPDGDQGTGELERRTLAEVFRAVQQTPLPVPLQNPALLPVGQLDPEVLERLAAELVCRRDNLGAYFYGRRPSTAWTSSNSSHMPPVLSTR